MNKKGMTFTEVIVSVLFISILAAGVFSAFVGAQYFFNRATHRLQAFNFVREVYDTLRSNYTYTDSQMSVGDGHLESEIGSIIKGELADLGAVVTYDVAETQPDGYKSVSVHISWDERSYQ